VFVADLGEGPAEFYVVPVIVMSDIALRRLRQGGDRPRTPGSGHSAMSPGDGWLDAGWLEAYRDRWDLWQLWDGAGWPHVAPPAGGARQYRPCREVPSGDMRV